VDAIDILGDLLGRRMQKPGRGADALKDIFGRGSRSSETTQVSREEIQSQSDDLEELLNVANKRAQHRHSSAEASRSEPQQQPHMPNVTSSENEKAMVLLRAMINAAKADGQLDRSEQQKIMERLGNASPDKVEFLRQELARPLNARDFVDQVPIGMEEPVYKLSLIAVDLDTRREAEYLMQLAQGLRIPVNERERIHAELGAPSMY